MTLATAAVSVLLASLLALSALLKLSHRERIVQQYARVGVPEEKLNALAVLLLAGAVGLVLGLFWAPIGVAAALCLVCYFTVAIVFHIRANDAGNLPMPLALAALAGAALALQLAAL